MRKTGPLHCYQIFLIVSVCTFTISPTLENPRSQARFVFYFVVHQYSLRNPGSEAGNEGVRERFINDASTNFRVY